MTTEWTKEQALTTEEILRREHDAFSSSRKVIDGPVYFPKIVGGTTNVLPISGAVNGTSSVRAMEPNKAYRLISTVNAHFRLSVGASAATTSDIILPANVPIVIRSGGLWDTVNIIKATLSADGLAQIVEIK